MKKVMKKNKLTRGDYAGVISILVLAVTFALLFGKHSSKQSTHFKIKVGECFALPVGDVKVVAVGHYGSIVKFYNPKDDKYEGITWYFRFSSLTDPEDCLNFFLKKVKK